jgi:hypothetical protein
MEESYVCIMIVGIKLKRHMLFVCLFFLFSSLYAVQLQVRNVDAQVNLLKPTGYVMHQQFNIQQLYALPTLYLCVLYLSENKQRLVTLTA